MKLSISPAQNDSRVFPPSQAGQFVQIQCNDSAPPAQGGEIESSSKKPPHFSQPELMKAQALLRRPLSLAGRVDSAETTELTLIYRVIGVGTAWLGNITPPQTVSVLGPLGNSLPIIPGKNLAALVGGGVGIPPMLYAAELLGWADKQVIAFCGGRTKNHLPLTIDPENEEQLRSGQVSLCCREFTERGAMASIASEDGTLGFNGLVTEPFENWLDSDDVSADDLVVYSCGPEPMMRVVGEICITRGIECYLSLERHMACGMGTCQSCIVKIRDDSRKHWNYKLCCTQGPVFRAEDILWE